jgi:hypothetical protein
MSSRYDNVTSCRFKNVTFPICYNIHIQRRILWLERTFLE